MKEAGQAGKKSRRDARVARLSTKEDGTPQGGNSNAGVHLPEPFTNSVVIKAYTKQELPTTEVLTNILEANGLDTTTWGSGNTKAVYKYWKEIEGLEASLELWRTAAGKTIPVRVTHVLRAKVTSPAAYQRNVFLFNTWQQYGDGRKRIRNGLLSEKLTTEEMPLIANLHDVCQRAVTEEEMQRVVSHETRIGPGMPAPTYDLGYKCPMNVVNEEFVDHMVEIEASKSYPGLITAYHLYTVDIICEGLPLTDFNTLEFDHPDKDGNRALKYIHAWVWHEWTTIQRYLFDGSEMKERKSKGSFKDVNELMFWLSQFDIDLSVWGTGSFKDVPALFRELEKSESQLERWGRDDGVPLLMRVVHVLQIKVVAREGSQSFLFQIWDQHPDGKVRDVNRSLAKKLSAASLPFDATHFEKVAKAEIASNLTFLADVHTRLDSKRLPTPENCERSDVKVLNVNFMGHRFDLEDSKSFPEMTTMYHLYTVEATCEGLPRADFASISFDHNGSSGAMSAQGWKWMTWQSTLDIMHQRTQMLERREAGLSDKIAAATAACEACMSRLAPGKGFTTKGMDVEKVKKEFKQVLDVLTASSAVEAPMYQQIPPSLVSNLADQKGVSDDFLDQALIGPTLSVIQTPAATAITINEDLPLEESNGTQELKGPLPASTITTRQVAPYNFCSMLCCSAASPDASELRR